MKKTFFKLLGIIAIVAMIGFGLVACEEDAGSSSTSSSGGATGGSGGTGGGIEGGGDETPVPGMYTGKDVLGNTYSLSVTSNASSSVSRSASRAVSNGDHYTMSIKTRNGTKNVKAGTVTGISADGTLTLQPDGGGEAFTATVGSSNLKTVASADGDIAQIPLANGETITPRTFNEIYLRATRWVNGAESGEQYGSLNSVLVKDFPTNVSKLQKNTNNRYKITISGTSSMALEHSKIEVQGMVDADNWKLLAVNYAPVSIPAGTFNLDVALDVGNDSWSYDLMDYPEVIMQVTNVMYYHNTEHTDWNQDYGTIPSNIENGQIGATISNFKIVLKDTTREAFKGNMEDYTYGFQEDGLAVDYRQAVWHLTSANIAAAKQSGARFEFIMPEMDDIETYNPTLCFVWQDPSRGLWWQDQKNICEGDANNSWAFTCAEGVTWDASDRRLTIELSKVIKDSRFSGATEANFIIGCWWGGGQEARNVGDLVISGANIFVAPPPTTGNIGNYRYGYEEDGIEINYKQAVWNLPSDVYSTAKTAGAKLEIVFSQDIETRAGGTPMLVLIWQDITSGRWWPSVAQAGTNNVNITLCHYDEGAGNYTYHSGVTYDSATKKLTITLNTALETYSSFSTLTNPDVNFVLSCWYGITSSINELGIVSVNIVAP